MAEGTEPIRQDIEAIRDSMTDKMEQLESRVKGTVEETVDTVRRTFDVRQHVDERPWTTLGAAVAAGFVLGNLGSDSDSTYRYAGYRHTTVEDTPIRSYRADTASRENGNSFWSTIADQFGDELNIIATAAIQTAVGALRETFVQGLPQFDREYKRARQGDRAFSAQSTGRMTADIDDPDELLRQSLAEDPVPDRLARDPYRAHTAPATEVRTHSI
jgi:ElaB/YqjD/DUF883 family membrane-anchored ribosome-binding protein